MIAFMGMNSDFFQRGTRSMLARSCWSSRHYSLECLGRLDCLEGLGVREIPWSPCFRVAPQDLWLPSCLEGLVSPVHLVGLCLLEFPGHPVKEEVNKSDLF